MRHGSTSSGAAKKTGIAFGWISATPAFGSAVRKGRLPAHLRRSRPRSETVALRSVLGRPSQRSSYVRRVERVRGTRFRSSRRGGVTSASTRAPTAAPRRSHQGSFGKQPDRVRPPHPVPVRPPNSATCTLEQRPAARLGRSST